MNYNRLKQRCNNYLNHYTFRNIGYLTVGNIISQIISFIGALYIPNLLGPERYGVYNTVFAYVGIFSVFTFSGLNKVVIRESSKDIKNTMKDRAKTMKKGVKDTWNEGKDNVKDSAEWTKDKMEEKMDDWKK